MRVKPPRAGTDPSSIRCYVLDTHGRQCTNRASYLTTRYDGTTDKVRFSQLNPKEQLER